MKLLILLCLIFGMVNAKHGNWGWEHSGEWNKPFNHLQNYFGEFFYGDIFEVETDQNLAKVGSKSWPFQ